MVVFPNAKINLGLRVIRRRSDGFHDLQTVFYPLPFNDILEVLPAQRKEVSLQLSGLTIDGAREDNLCMKAYRLVQQDFPQLPPAQMHLHKLIPSGGGLGGGSADAAFLLLALNKLFRLKLPAERLHHYALTLGSDCPFFLINRPCLATGRGENLEPLALDLSAYQWAIINPGIRINTGQAFSSIIPALPAKPIAEVIQQPLTTWKKELLNDFEPSVFAGHPTIAGIKEQLYQAGASYASLSGSGSTVFGIFGKERELSFSFPKHYAVRVC